MFIIIYTECFNDLNGHKNEAKTFYIACTVMYHTLYEYDLAKLMVNCNVHFYKT